MMHKHAKRSDFGEHITHTRRHEYATDDRVRAAAIRALALRPRIGFRALALV
jgi:hypothetical protein